MELIIIFACFTIGAVIYLAYKAGYAEARKKYEMPDALESYYNGLNAGYTSGYNDGAREYWNLNGKVKHGRVCNR